MPITVIGINLKLYKAPTTFPKVKKYRGILYKWQNLNTKAIKYNKHINGKETPPKYIQIVKLTDK